MLPETRESVLDFLDWLKIFDEMRSQITGFMKEFVTAGKRPGKNKDGPKARDRSRAFGR